MKTRNKNSYFFYFLVLNIVAFSMLFLLNPKYYDWLSDEDRLVENLTALSLFLSGVLFFLSAFKSGGLPIGLKVALFFIGLIFILGAGEEISWGQRIFNFETPEGLKKINDQNETNIHNINKKFFDRALDRLTILFVLLTTILRFIKKKTFLKFPLPSYYLILAFGLTPFYNQYSQLNLNFFHLIYIAFILIFIAAYKSKDVKLILATLISITITPIIMWLHVNYNHHFEAHNNAVHEYREYLFSICCLAYAYMIFQFFKIKNSSSV